MVRVCYIEKWYPKKGVGYEPLGKAHQACRFSGTQPAHIVHLGPRVPWVRRLRLCRILRGLNLLFGVVNPPPETSSKPYLV